MPPLPLWPLLSPPLPPTPTPLSTVGTGKPRALLRRGPPVRPRDVSFTMWKGRGDSERHLGAATAQGGNFLPAS